MDQNLKRISLLIRVDQYENINKSGLNLSGLVRDLLDDYFSQHKITIGVSEPTKSLYDQIVANTGSTDRDIERYFRECLRDFLNDRIKEMQTLERTVFGKPSKEDGN